MTMTGYQNKVLRIDLSGRKYSTEPLNMEFAEKYGNGKIISFLEGGYSHRGLSESVYQHLKCFIKK